MRKAVRVGIPLCADCGEQDIDCGRCDGCERDICPSCVKWFPKDPIHIFPVCRWCAADTEKESAFMAELDPALVVRMQTKMAARR